MVSKPFKRTVRQLEDGTYSNSGNGLYVLHPDFTNDPQHYIRAYLIIQNDLQELFEYIEPCDQNLDTVSLKIQQLLIRVCIEIEANFTAILKENKYSSKLNWNIKNSYCLIDYSHHLSSYKVKFPIWKGYKKTRKPFKNWFDKTKKDWHVLDWYKAYNKSKHDRHTNFNKATLDNLLDAISALIILLSSQFLDEEYSPNSKSLGISGNYSYDYDPRMQTAIGEYFQIQFPDNWSDDEKYDFNWEKLKEDINPINIFNYDKIKGSKK